MLCCEFSKVIRDLRLIIIVSHHHLNRCLQPMLIIEPFFVIDMLSHRVDFLSLVNHQLQDHLNLHHLLLNPRHHHRRRYHRHHHLVSHHLRLDLHPLINSDHLINFDFVSHLYHHHQHHLHLNKV